MWTEFRAFVARGNVLDLAVAVVIGAAFGKIVSSLVDGVIMPIVGNMIGGVNFSALAYTLQDGFMKGTELGAYYTGNNAEEAFYTDLTGYKTAKAAGVFYVLEQRGYVKARSRINRRLASARA